MSRRIKGAGSLSRKLTAILMLSAMSTLGYAADNSIYIDQSGDDAQVTITQNGSGNVVRGLQSGANDNTIPARIVGDGVKVTIDQIGPSNKLDLGINATVGTGGRSAEVKYSTVDRITGLGAGTSGNNATININADNSKTTSNVLIDVAQLNGGNTLNVNAKGENNSLTATQTGGNATLVSIVNASNTTQTIDTSGGSGNSVTTNLTSDKGNVDVKVVGTTNTISITQQDAAGTNGHIAKLDIDGNSNSVTLTQKGSVDNTFNLKVSGGNGNTYNVIQRN